MIVIKKEANKFIGTNCFPHPTSSQVVHDTNVCWLSVVEEEEKRDHLVMELKFQAADVKKPLIAVKRIGYG